MTIAYSEEAASTVEGRSCPREGKISFRRINEAIQSNCVNAGTDGLFFVLWSPGRACDSRTLVRNICASSQDYVAKGAQRALQSILENAEP